MKRILLGTIVACLALTLGAAAYAALGLHGGLTGVTEGDCSACHNNQATAATRGWTNNPAPTGTTGWFNTGAIGITKLCYSCHSAGNSYNAHNVTTTAMADNSHGHNKANAPPFPVDNGTSSHTAGSDNVTNSNLPYAATADIQCTSCHNVHNGDNRPFNIKASVGAMCQECHDGRNFSTVGAANTHAGIGGNYSTHPVGVAVTDITTNGTNQFKTTIDALLTEAFPAALTTPWTLAGGRLSGGSTGNISCETCHAVHGYGTLNGINYDNPVTGTEDLLSIDNRPADQTAISSALCEGCHYGGAAGNSVGASGTSDHPIDNVTGRPFYPQNAANPTIWSTGRLDTYDVMYQWQASPSRLSPRCSSCHDTHSGVAATSLLRGAWAADGYCFTCHTDTYLAPQLHHSTKATWTPSQIDCKGCHGTSYTGGTIQSWSAHNGFGGFAVGADIPGTGLENTAYNFYAGTVNSASFQRLCEYCHLPNDPTTFQTARGFTQPSGTTSVFPASHGNWNASNKGTHLVTSLTDTGGAQIVRDMARTYNSFMRKSQWPNTSSSTNLDPAYRNQPIYSKYIPMAGGGTVTNPTDNGPTNGAAMICESCHNLILNAGVPPAVDCAAAGYNANLLVYAFADRGTTAGSVTTGDAASLCRGCHNQGAWDQALSGGLPYVQDNTSYVHYPAAHTTLSSYFTYDINPYGRSTSTLMTTFDNTAGTGCNTSTADASGAPGVFAYSNSNRMDCDTCHRVHNADSESLGATPNTNPALAATRWWILEPGSVTTAGQAKTQACTQCHDAGWNCGNK